MTLWLLEPKDDLINSPWKPLYDKMCGIVVRAVTVQEARQIAHDNAGDENYEDTEHKGEPWLDKNISTCVELLPEGKSGVILRDVASA
jgi:hypothetical protein